MTTLQLLLPDDLSRFLNSLGKDKEAFVLDAIKSKLANNYHRTSTEQLAEAYRSSAKEAKKISIDYVNVDLEHWDEY